MITEASAWQELKRLSALTTWKNVDAAGKAEFTRILAPACRTQMELAAAISEWLRTEMFAPSPSDLLGLITGNRNDSLPSGNCPDCSGSGRRSFWGLVTVERWPDSGRIKRRRVEEIPIEGERNLWLLSWPALAKQVDGENQLVEMFSAFCACDYGRRFRDAQAGKANS